MILDTSYKYCVCAKLSRNTKRPPTKAISLGFVFVCPVRQYSGVTDLDHQRIEQ